MSFLTSLRHWADQLRRDGLTLWFAGRHPATPIIPKALCLIAVAYALSPIDLIPDFIPVLGYLDDLILLPAIIWLSLQLMPAAIVVWSRSQADGWIAERRERPRSMVGAVAVVGIWIGLAVAAVYWVR